MQPSQRAAVLCALVALTMSLGGVGAFQMFGGHSGSRGSGSSLGETVRFLVRTVDAPDPYFRSMTFFVPKELNYMLGEYLHKNFSRMLEHHCSVTNITMIVRNDVQLLLTDYDVWTLRNGDRIEIWSKQSGPPTRAQTMMAYAQPKYLRPGRPCTGSACTRNGGRGGRWRASGRGSYEVVAVPDESAKMVVEAEAPLSNEEPIVVPDWSQMP